MAERPYALSIAGIDPSAGAGLLADIKAFEQLEVYGLGIPSSNTVQTEKEFFSNQWVARNYILEGTQKMLDNYPIKAVKVGIIEDLELLKELTKNIKSKNPEIKVVWDPVIRSTTNFEFNDKWKLSKDIFNYIDVITPNTDEWHYLQLIPQKELKCSILLKGGHHKEKKGYDKLWWDNEWIEIPPQTSLNIHEKHGSGCVLSSALTAQLSKGENMLAASKQAKEYTEKFLSSTREKLGYHNGKIALHITR
ncbi:MAG: bifunctional hydroxymethylpyrimidine kinase/phosphomethylpyrimidine kinase [Candidatus Cyclobacteriaceae bacterium M2_1C_046]